MLRVWLRSVVHPSAFGVLALAAALCAVACNSKPIVSLTCLPNGICITPSGQKVHPDGSPIVCGEFGGDCSTTGGGSGAASTGGTAGNTGGTGNATTGGYQPNPNGIPISLPGHRTQPATAPAACKCALSPNDTDGDCLPDALETATGISDPTNWDTDGDGIGDGCEDVNHDGVVKTWVDVNSNGCFDPNIDVPGESNPRNIDTDFDGVLDGHEDANMNGIYDPGETIAWHPDTDCDLLTENKEDLNKNGVVDVGETDPRNKDTDGDNLPDGTEDANQDGRYEPGVETSPLLVDTDGDGIADGVEDQNLNGKVDPFVDTNGNGCWDPGETAGESDPRLLDSDGDGISDGYEDVNHNGICDVSSLPSALDPNNIVRTFTETCAWLADTDCDGLTESREDKNRNASVDAGETDPRNPDSDYDTLTDGCPKVPAPGCEDKNNNGILDPNETDPTQADTDGDLLPDGCEVNFGPHPPAGGTNPLNIDTDGDGIADGDEDANHNCTVDNGETDPRIYNAPPPSGSTGYPQWSVCAAENLNALSFAQNANNDFKLAFEVEKTTTVACPGNVDSQCPAGQHCINSVCTLSASYFTQAFGRDADGNGFSDTDPNDVLWGYVFESPPGVVVDTTTGTVLNRDVYGFVQVNADTRALDDILDSIRNAINASTANIGVATEVGNLPSRAAFDSNPNSKVNFAQRQISIAAANPTSSLALRNALLLNVQLGGVTPDNPPPTSDPVYGQINCSGGNNQECYSTFTLYIGAVQRLNQIDPAKNAPRVLITMALTPDTSNPAAPSDPNNRFYADRSTRLEDLTGGSALARFQANVSKACDSLPQRLAEADMLWVVDDSRSMQQIITRLQHAATDAQAVLTANSGIVDFRVAMTTTNPSRAARTRCPDTCDSTCGPKLTSCDIACADQTLGCIRECPMPCTGEVCDSNNVCQCTSCPSASGPTCPTGGDANHTCSDPNNFAQAIAQDALSYTLPGGGGTFYYEDTRYLDCDSSNTSSGNSQNGQVQYLNSCSNPNYNNAAAPVGSFAAFYGNGFTDKALTAHARLIHSDPNANCPTSQLDLRFDTHGGVPCNDPNQCCARLTDVCTDGPSVLASQMCDVIRAMGGLPALDFGFTTSSARRHSSPEHGTRSARRLLESMIPALPLDYTGSYDPNTHLRLNCLSTDYNCGVCDPTAPATSQPQGDSHQSCPSGLDSDCWTNEQCVNGTCYRKCVPIPVATVVLSDEEDFWFKDDCQATQSAADQKQLPASCLYVDGDPNTTEACTAAYCQPYLGTDPNKPADPNGYDPDQTAWTADGFFTGKWRDPNANECSSLGNTSTCISDPCPALDANHCGCAPGDNACVTAGVGSAGAAYPYCYWKSGACYSSCATHTLAFINTAAQAQAQATACLNDPVCAWAQDQVSPSSQQNACVLKFPINDCQPCKRFLRQQEAVNGGAALVGFGQVGPVYAIVRNKGAPGEGGFLGTTYVEDTCKGGAVTWGRGDGQAYRDAAISTLGRTQDVCAQSYQNFMQLVTADLAVLSRPYPLTAAPIAATIKVGIARPMNDGSTAYIAVPRSRTQGFLYDPTNNSIGFKSDPIDGQCGGGSCSANGIIEPAEVTYARTAPTVPQPGDTIYVSYRVWLPIPCLGQCPVGEACARTVCETANSGQACSATLPCRLGYSCVNGSCTCQPGQIVDMCVANPSCGSCQQYDPASQTCVAAASINNCPCSASGKQACNPQGGLVNQCPIGWSCDSTCVCDPIPGCGNVFNSDETVTSCSAALACCTSFSTAAQTCLTHASQGACTGDTNCAWGSNGTCGYRFATCCPSNTQPQCFSDPESGINTIFCTSSSCTCNCPANLECDVANNCTCYQNGG